MGTTEKQIAAQRDLGTQLIKTTGERLDDLTNAVNGLNSAIKDISEKAEKSQKSLFLDKCCGCCNSIASDFNCYRYCFQVKTVAVDAALFNSSINVVAKIIFYLGENP